MKNTKKYGILTKTFFASTVLMLVLALLTKYGISILNLKLLIILTIYLGVILLVEYAHKKTHEIVRFGM